MSSAAAVYDSSALLEEALDNFTALVDDTDYDGILEMLGIGKFHFLRRKQMRIEWGALRMALWRLALARSFPENADCMFDEFLKRYTILHPDKQSAQMVTRAREYWGMLLPGGDADFMAAAHHLVSFLEIDPAEARSLILKLALFIRSDYKFIFERLI